MKIRMHRYLRGSAYSSLTIDEGLLEDVNDVLARSYVIAHDLSEVPQIESVEMLEKLLIECTYGNEYTSDYDIIFTGLNKKDGTVSRSVPYESLYEVVYDLVINYLYDEPFEIDDYDTTDYDFEVEE